MKTTQDYITEDINHLWHPFTQMAIWPDEPPIVIDRAEGNWLIDTNGNRYFDGVSSLWVTVHGHNHPRIKAAIAGQMEKLDHSTLLGLTHGPAINLAKRLAEITPPGLNKVFYSESGSTAVEIALKIAFQYWQQVGRPEKKGFVALENAYHGDTLGSVSVGGISLFHQVYGPLLFDVHRISQPHKRGVDPASLLSRADELEAILSEKAGQIAALIVEPRVQGACGIVPQPKGYVKRLYDICKKHDVLFIADEVAVGFCRTGHMFACEKEGVTPDLMALGKGLTGGVLPLAATMATDEVYQGFCGEFEDFKTFFHGHTYTGNPMTCAAALANLDLMKEAGMPESCAPAIERFSAGLKDLAEMPHVLEVRHEGLMAAVELGLDKETDTAYPEKNRTGHKVIMAARKHGVIVRPLGDAVVIMPPICSTPEEIDYLISGVKRAIIEVTEG